MVSFNERLGATELQIAEATKDLAKQEGELPKLKPLQQRTGELRGEPISNGGLYNIFSRYGSGGLADFARAHGVYPAAIVDGKVYSTYLTTEDSVSGELTGFDLHGDSPVLSPTSEANAEALRSLPTSELLGLLGDIAIILKQRSEIQD